MKDLLKIKQEMKRKKPNFTRSDCNKKTRISGKSWRKPNGLHSKMRLCHLGFKRRVSIGYRSPCALRDMEKSGLKKVIVRNLADLEKIDAKKEIALIANIGMKKKIEIAKEAQKRKLTIANIKNVGEFLESSQKTISERKDMKKAREEKKLGKTKEKKEAKKEEKKQEEISPEEKEKMEKKEKEKLIIKKQ